jgi:hypothetical protein
MKSLTLFSTRRNFPLGENIHKYQSNKKVAVEKTQPRNAHTKHKYGVKNNSEQQQ